MRATNPLPENESTSSNVRAYRPIRNGELRVILDQEFTRSYRFEGISDFVHDIKGIFRHFVDRRDRLEREEMLKSPFDRT